MESSLLLRDGENESLSIMFSMKIGDYVELVNSAYKQSGGIENQRTALKTKTGQRIRRRMVDDITKGTILPPVVLGATVDSQLYERFSDLKSESEVLKLLDKLDELSIIDGMQRTTALQEALAKLNESDQAREKISNSLVRVELWVAKSVNSLIYRMLVLNTGQVPWDMKRQLQTIYKSILKEVNQSVSNINILDLKEPSRRTKGGQFQGDKLIEYFLAFSSRKTKIDIKEKVAEDFARMDVTEATSSNKFLPSFMTSLQLLVDLDNEFSRATLKSSDNQELYGKIKQGKDIFQSSPAGIGFVTACSIFLFGRAGYAVKEEQVIGKKAQLEANVNALVGKLKGLSNEER